MELLKKGSKGELVKQLQTKLGVTADGLFGSGTENALKAWQACNGLVADGVAGSLTWSKMFGLSPEPKKCIGGGVIYNPINVHISSKPNRSIKYIVLHFTAGSSSKLGKAHATRNVFLSRQASADFAVDDVEIVQCNPDLRNYYCWSVGDGKGKYKIANSNSVSIEMCSTLKQGANVNVANHAGWSITEDVLANTIKLVRMLMKEFNIPIENVVRHYDASRKSCPGLVGWNNNYLADEITGKHIGMNNSEKWLAFKKRIVANP